MSISAGKAAQPGEQGARQRSAEEWRRRHDRLPQRERDDARRLLERPLGEDGATTIGDACRELACLNLKRIGGGEKSYRRVSRRRHLLTQTRAVRRLGDVLRPGLSIGLRGEQRHALVQIIDLGRGARDEARELLRQGIEPVSQFGQGRLVELRIVERSLDLVELGLHDVELRLLALRIGIRRLRDGLGGRGRALSGGRGRRGLRPCGGRQEGAGDQRRDGEPKRSPGLQP